MFPISVNGVAEPMRGVRGRFGRSGGSGPEQRFMGE